MSFPCKRESINYRYCNLLSKTKKDLWKNANPCVFIVRLIQIGMLKSKRKKIFYVPGIISLIILPIVFIYFAKTKIKEKDMRVISLFWADTNFMKAHSSLFFKSNKQSDPIREYTNIVFTGNSIDDNIKLAFAQIRIKEILTKNDTTSGLHFIFNDSSNYGTFVKAIDILQSNEENYYVPCSNNIWFYNLSHNEKLLPNDFLLMNDVIIGNPKIPFWKTLKKKIILAWSSSWEMILLFGVFVFSIAIIQYKNHKKLSC